MTINSEKNNSSDDRRTIDLNEIVPEYQSLNPLVRFLFNSRLSVIIKRLRKLRTRNLLDVGCGSGKLLEMIQGEDLGIEKMFGIDINPNILSLEGTIKNCEFTVQSIMSTDFNDSFFDTVVCMDVLEHFEKPEQALTEIQRILSSTGHLITSMPTESVLYKSLRLLIKGTYSSETGPAAGTHYYHARELDRKIRSSGFQRLSLKKLPLPFPLDLFQIGVYQNNK